MLSAKTFGILFLFFIHSQAVFAQQAPSLFQLLDLVVNNSSELEQAHNTFLANEALTTSKRTLPSPTIGFSTLERSGKTNYFVFSQKFNFPVKYYIKGKAQESISNAKKQNYNQVKLRIKQNVSNLYYSIYSAQKIINLTKANMETVREFARVAEKKYAAGKAPQSDSMKAHFEQTKLELELLQLKQKEHSLQLSLKALLNNYSFPDLDLSRSKLKVPIMNSLFFKKSGADIFNDLSKHSPILISEQHLVKKREWDSQLAKWEYAPDFQVQYQERIDGVPDESRIYGISMTIPLYFWKQAAKVSSAQAEFRAQQFKLKNRQQILLAKVNDLKSRVKVGSKSLKIYQTTLIPQAQGAYNSSRASYRANKSSFLGLLDSERSLYSVQTHFYQSLRQYILDLSLLESSIGYSISNLGEE